MNPTFIFLSFLEKLKIRLNEYKTRTGLTYFKEFSVTYQTGKKYFKVFREEIPHTPHVDHHNHKTIVCFIDCEGNIYKPANYKTPAKGIRGNVNSPENGMEAIQGFVRYLR